MSVTLEPIWHVHFDGQPSLMGHVCDLHKEIGQTFFACDDADADGNCPHVQLVRCTCAEPPACDGCLVDDARG